MEPEVKNKNATAESQIDGSVSFSQVSTVANGLVLDFLFVSLCRRFKEGKFDEFNETLSTFQAICPSLEGNVHHDKTMICAFLARVMHGKQLDVQFEEEVHVMPLMSAAKIWPDLEHTVEDESVFKMISHLLLVQSVAVCLAKGRKSSASSALKWFENSHKIPQNTMVKLSTVVRQRESYHPFLANFSFSRLLETIKSYLDAYLEKNPSDYLLKEATKMVQSSQNIEGLEDVVTKDSSRSEEANKSTQNRKRKRKLLSTKISDAWKNDSVVSRRRISQNELSKTAPTKSMDTPEIRKTRKPPQKWRYHLDRYLKVGVDRHGEGNWSRILMDFDFEGRTGTMLKDRWRILVKSDKVG